MPPRPLWEGSLQTYIIPTPTHPNTQGRRYRGGGVWGGVTPPNNSKLVKVGQNGSDICPKLVKME
jgi:hypothetical protein